MCHTNDSVKQDFCKSSHVGAILLWKMVFDWSYIGCVGKDWRTGAGMRE
jgi:hypothetical protein